MTAAKIQKQTETKKPVHQKTAPIDKQSAIGTDKKLAIILIRGMVDKRGDIRDTLKFLNLKRKNNCAIFDDTPSIKGMVNKVKDLVTWGELNEETLSLVAPKLKDHIVRLQPPRGGFERKGTKVSFNNGGALGYRGDKINMLIKRMT